jgi:hypothetical protein
MPDPVDARRVSDLPLDELVACHECDLLMRKPHLASVKKLNARAVVMSSTPIAITS